ncbi:helix-turn-helix domain-containing protein [Pseudomonas fluorescens]|uniref:helix-turn-helix domain-containing protein n=1 Tax=Pseudomonas fluorescens TaxID=294 RepID=UPI001242BDAC|nr:AraC family transcriptional regulator [Pseudomonas fluorescens]VVN43656.1 HTH-type transcriptional activator RhaR [Pseudomonas fluorescens]
MNSESGYQNLEEGGANERNSSVHAGVSYKAKTAAGNLLPDNYYNAHHISIQRNCPFVVAVQLKELASHQLWISSHLPSSNLRSRGGVITCDFDGEKAPFLVSSFDGKNSYTVRSSGSNLTDSSSLKGELQCCHGEIDPVIEGLIKLALDASDEQGNMSGEFAEQLAAVLHAHVLCRHASEPTLPTPAGQLATWQEHRAKEMMCAQLDGEVCIESIARACNLSPTHFSRAFAATVGTPPHRWLVQRRTYKACDLLQRTNLSLSEIASLCGFADQSHFTRVFKKIIGTSPGVWKRRATAP